MRGIKPQVLLGLAWAVSVILLLIAIDAVTP
jgi:hypothetical protein